MKKSNEYKAWYRKNDPQNARKDFKEYNRQFSERYKRPPEYAKSAEEYHHYPERYDYTKDQDVEKSEDQKRQDQKQNNSAVTKSQAAGKSIVKTVVGSAVAVVVGAIILVTSYQTLKAKSVPTFNVSWTWSDDYLSCILKLESTDKSIRKQIDIVTEVTEEVLPTCVTNGHRLYTASSDYRDVTYTDVRNEVLYAQGHHFDNGVVMGSYIEYTCADCGEHVRVDIDIEEND